MLIAWLPDWFAWLRFDVCFAKLTRVDRCFWFASARVVCALQVMHSRRQEVPRPHQHGNHQRAMRCVRVRVANKQTNKQANKQTSKQNKQANKTKQTKQTKQSKQNKTNKTNNQPNMGPQQNQTAQFHKPPCLAMRLFACSRCVVPFSGRATIQTNTRCSFLASPCLPITALSRARPWTPAHQAQAALHLRLRQARTAGVQHHAAAPRTASHARWPSCR